MLLSLITIIHCLANIGEADPPPPLAHLQLSYAFAVDGGEVQGAHIDTKCVAMSTFKVYIALAALKHIDEQKSSLETAIVIPKEEWEQQTWSPLQKLHRGRDVEFTLAALLDAMLIQSDNIATDAIIAHVGGIKGVNSTLSRMGMPHIQFSTNERQMQQSRENAALNRLSPRDVVETLRLLRQGKLLSTASTTQLIQRMQACQTGKEKIRAQFPQLLVANRSGGSGRADDGIVLADNDIGFIVLPSGSCLYLAIYINDSRASDGEHRRIFRQVCEQAKAQLINEHTP